MAFIPPKFQPLPKGGLMFVNPPGVANFRALRVESGDQHLYWQPTYQHILRVEGAFGEFFPQAEFSDNGNQVIFSKYVDNTEVLSQTRALSPGERIPRAEWQRFLATWTNFKRLADRTDIPEDVRNFIFKFGPPSVERYPAAYRIYRPHWYSRSRLFILWGLEPVGGADFVPLTPEEAVSQGSARAESNGEETSASFLRWLKIFLFGLLALTTLLFLIWCCLPRPIVDFKVTAEAEKPAVTQNLTTLDRSWEWGDTEFKWLFAHAIPGDSTEFEPTPRWFQPGPHEVTLQAVQSTLWGLLYKTDAKTITVTVTPPPKPPVVVPRHRPHSEDRLPHVEQAKPDGKMEKPSGLSVPEGKKTPHSTKPETTQPDGQMAKPPGDHLPDEKMSKDKQKPEGTKPDGKMEKSPGPSVPEGKMTPDAAKPDGQMAKPPGDHLPDEKMPKDKQKPEGTKPDGKTEKPPGPSVPEGKMTPDAAKPDADKPDGRMEKLSDANASEGKMSPDKAKPDGSKPEGKTEKPPGPSAPGGKMPPDEAKPEHHKPAPMVPSPPPRSQILPVPRVVITTVNALDDGKSQDIAFSLLLPDGVRLDHLYLDGDEIDVSSDGSFRRRLPVGPHSVHIEYGSPKSGLRGQVTQELMVDSDQVQIIKPKTHIAPPVQIPGSGQVAPSPVRPKDEAAEKFDKKTA